MINYHNKRKTVSILIIASLLFALDGCGFRLRGSGMAAVALPVTYVAGNTGDTLVRDLKQALKNSGTQLVNDKARAELVLSILNERRDRRALSVSTAGKVQEYQLHYLVTFSVADKAGKLLLDNQSVSTTRNYSYQDTAVLAKGEEEEQLYKAMRRDAVQSIMRRLQAMEL